MADPELEAAKQKLDALGEQIAQLRTQHVDAAKPSPDNSGYGLGMRIAVELLAGLGLGLIVGLWLDGQFSSSPLATIICILLGVVGGLWNAVRMANRPAPKPTKNE